MTNGKFAVLCAVVFAAGFAAVALNTVSSVPTILVSAARPSVHEIFCASNPRANECGGRRDDRDQGALAAATDNLGHALDNVRNLCGRAGGTYDSPTNRCMNVPDYGNVYGGK